MKMQALEGFSNKFLGVNVSNRPVQPTISTGGMDADGGKTTDRLLYLPWLRWTYVPPWRSLGALDLSTRTDDARPAEDAPQKTPHHYFEKCARVGSIGA